MRYLAGCVAVSLLFCSLSWAVDQSSAPSKDALLKSLKDVQAQLASAEEQLAGQAKDIWQKQHDVTYADPECVRLNTEVKELEKQLMEKRRALDQKVMSADVVRAIHVRRNKLLQALQDLKAKEKSLVNQLTGDAQPAVAPAP